MCLTHTSVLQTRVRAIHEVESFAQYKFLFTKWAFHDSLLYTNDESAATTDSGDNVSALLGITVAVHRIGVQFLRVVSWKTASNRANGAAQLG